jgi:hypothetical protein
VLGEGSGVPDSEDGDGLGVAERDGVGDVDGVGERDGLAERFGRGVRDGLGDRLGLGAVGVGLGEEVGPTEVVAGWPAAAGTGSRTRK